MKLTHRAYTLSFIFYILLQCAAAPSLAEVPEQSLLANYPAGSISSVDSAEMALTEVEAVRNEVGRRFDTNRAACMDKFLMSRCIAEAKEMRRSALHAVRQVEVEANAFLRKERAAERERKIAERQNRAVRPLDGPSIPISGAARESSNPTPETTVNVPSQTEKP